MNQETFFEMLASLVGLLYPKSVIRHAESVSDGENEAFGHLARLCHASCFSLRLDVARYAFG